MIAYEIRLNGEVICVAGQEDISILHTNVVVSRDNAERDVDDYIRLTIGGLSQDMDNGYPEHIRWKGCDLDMGDTVQIKIIETSEISSPVRRYRSDDKAQESPFTETELRELRYKDYLALKKEFEPVSPE